MQLDDGTLMRVGYDGKNGHPYTSIGRRLVELGQVAADAPLAHIAESVAQRGSRARAPGDVAQPVLHLLLEMGDGNDTGPLGALGATADAGAEHRH